MPTEVLGSVDTIGIDIIELLASYDIKQEFDNEVLDECNNLEVTIEEINNLLSNEIIQDFETKNLLNGGTYTSYQCKDCKYRSICDMNATNEGTTNNC